MALIPNLSTPTGSAYASPTGQVSPMGTTAKSPTQNITPPSNTLSPYQQNLSRYNLSSIPQGYSFAASGKLTNNAGQEYTAANNSTGTSTVTQPTTPTPQQPTYSPTNPVTLPGLLNQTANIASQPSANFTQAQNTAGTAATSLLNSAPQQNADVMAQKQRIQNLQNQAATAFASNSSNPIPLEFQQGRGQVLQNLYAQELNAEQTGLANTLQGNAQQQTAFTGAGNLANATAGAATSQQNTQQTGLLGAAGAAKPELGQYGQTYYNPLTAGASGGAGVQPSDPFYQTMQTYAQSLASGQSSAIPSSVTGNPALQAQLLQMAKAINPNFNYNQSLATGASQQLQTGQAQQYTSSAQQAKNLGMQLQQVITQAGINPNDLNALNSFVQKLATNTSDPNYQTFQNLINDMANTYASVLTPAGGSTTDMVRGISQSLLNSTQSGQSIIQVMQNLDAQVQAKIAGVPTAYGNQANGTSNTNTNGPTPPGLF